MSDAGKRPDLPFGRGTVFPSASAITLFAGEDCRFCDDDRWQAAYLVNIASELYWEHIHEATRARETCSRYGTTDRGKPRPGSLPPLAGE